MVEDPVVVKNVDAVALVRLAEVEKSVATVPTVVEEVLSTVCPDTVRAVVEAFWRLEFPVAVKRVAVVVAKVEIPVTPRVPATERRNPGVELPTPTFPLASTVKSETPVEEATLNGLIAEVEALCTLRAKEDEEALTPRTVPLSMSVEVPRVVEVSHRVAKPRAPPEMLDTGPSVEVATHLVEVPVDCSTIPRVPIALVES